MKYYALPIYDFIVLVQKPWKRFLYTQNVVSSTFSLIRLCINPQQYLWKAGKIMVWLREPLLYIDANIIFNTVSSRQLNMLLRQRFSINASLLYNRRWRFWNSSNAEVGSLKCMNYRKIFCRYCDGHTARQNPGKWRRYRAISIIIDWKIFFRTYR